MMTFVCLRPSSRARTGFWRTLLSGCLTAAVVVGAWFAAVPTASAQTDAAHRLLAHRAQLLIPSSSQSRAADVGARAHTNIRVVVPPADAATPGEAPPYLGYGYETPASLACIYRLVQPIRGCNPNVTTNTPMGGSESIAIVDAFDDPTAAADLQTFSTQFGVPFSAGKFSVVYASGTVPPVDPSGGWELEESLDIEYAHAMAPNAHLYLVEANSNSFVDLFTAVIVAGNLIQCGKTTTCPSGATGKGEVSMSWGGSEFTEETLFDSIMTAKNVVYLASAGDSPGVIYPSASPNVLSAGGTTTSRSLETGDLIAEIAWSDAGGGSSQVEPRPSYQNGIARYAGSTRATPDLSSDSNPNTGVWIYDSNAYEGEVGPWWIVGGTSVASPTLAGILNAAATASGSFASSTSAELSLIYSELENPLMYYSNFGDILYGACNYYSGTYSQLGYDFCTGLGSPRGLKGK